MEDVKKLLEEHREILEPMWQAMASSSSLMDTTREWELLRREEEHQLYRVNRDMSTVVKYVLGHHVDHKDLDAVSSKRLPTDAFALWEQDWSDLIQRCAATVDMITCLLTKTAEHKTQDEPTTGSEPRKPLPFLDALAHVVLFVLDSMNLSQQATFERAKKMTAVCQIRFILKEIASTLHDAAETADIKQKRRLDQRLAKRG